MDLQSMQPTPNAPEASDAPLYVRWGPNGSPYAIELKLDLVTKIRNLLTEAGGDDAEMGGVLLGSLPHSYSATVRVEDVEIIRRGENEGSTFIIDPSGENQVEDIRQRARETGRSVVGLFRSHRRPGALRPSLADRGLIATLFSEPVCVLLLIAGNEPHSAAFFVGQDRKLPAEPSVREFNFDERDFKLLPEVEPEPARQRMPQPQRPKPKASRFPVWIGAGGLVGVCVLYLVWQGSGTAKGIPLLRSNHLDLAASREGPGLRVTWNNSSRAFDHAAGARLVIKRAGREDQAVQLGLDELRLGAVEIANSAPRVDLTLVIDVPGTSAATQSANWERP